MGGCCGKPPETISKATLRNATAAFHAMDKDNSGALSADELTDALRSIGQYPSDHEVNCMVQQVDIDKSGTISLDEFLELIKQPNVINLVKPEIELREVYKILDKDNKGSVPMRTVVAFLGRCGTECPTEAEVDALVLKADLNGDGVISMDEFVDLFRDTAKRKSMLYVSHSVKERSRRNSLGLDSSNDGIRYADHKRLSTRLEPLQHVPTRPIPLSTETSPRWAEPESTSPVHQISTPGDDDDASMHRISDVSEPVSSIGSSSAKVAPYPTDQNT